MNKFINKVKVYFTKFLYLFPSRLPVGMAEFDTWAKSILSTYGWPDNDSFRFTLAAMVVNLGPTKAYKSKFFFGLAIHSAAAKQIAGEYFRELKEKQMAEQRANLLAAATKPVEVTTSSPTGSNESQG